MKRILGRSIGIGAVLFFAATTFFPDECRYAIDAMAHPWAYSLWGEATLTGDWRGQINFDGIGTREINLGIERKPLNSYRRIWNDEHPLQGAFTGWAKMPDDFGNSVHYLIFGSVNRNGSEIIIQLSPLDSHSSISRQTVVRELKGAWKGQTLELSGLSSMLLYDGFNYQQSGDNSVMPVKTLLTKQ